MPSDELSADEIEQRAELGRRIKAARELRRMSQDDLGMKARDDGLNRYDLAQIERGERTMQFAHRQALVRHLRVPERWFTAEAVDEIVGYEDPDVREDRLEAVADALHQVVERLDGINLSHAVHEAFEEYARRLGGEIGRLPPRSKRNRGRPPEEPPAAA